MSSPTSYGIILQARMSSARLPGKVLMGIMGKPMLQHQIETLRNGAKNIPLIVATSTDPSDDPIKDLCVAQNQPCFRGPLDDVITRFIRCAHEYGITHLIRVNGDNPLIDPACCKKLLNEHKSWPGDLLYASHRKGWPYGTGAELIAVSALEKVRSLTSDAYYLEHTIPYFFDYPNLFSCRKVNSPPHLHRPNLALSVDYLEDLELVRLILRELHERGESVSLDRIVRLMDEKPELQAINRHLHSGFPR